MGTVLVFAGVVVVVNLLLDIVYTLVDPRIRLG
jgi:ABC-type dipeptide/oligopeptide/nickel transport system permease component